MRRTYFCDYCGRSFQDNLHNRKKHLQGVQHQRAKKFWFDSFRDTATILAEELTKKPCRKFLQSGQCDFGASCKFSHMTDEDVQRLRRKVDEETKSEDPVCQAPNIDEWLEKRNRRKQNRSHGSDSEMEKASPDVMYWRPPGFPPLHELPPSLHPPPPGGWKMPLNIEWG
ncbi:zinc finger matrin-type protein 5 [Callorhinchus milii]|uniref:Zinc finger matrin-type protein 5 n=1 Tax=Callorhinchus milii TaxID=7868 RepID=K4FYQ0_CALMI|nr:zinc finger matrin-type protein 5 [Callorhinchus milii]AFK11552.1 zinc finger matrin-type protein 5-like protein [Callorhinchus milii]|eukprot:gi/632968393/ref/XP_007900502.1/ PREDICTED: zinc finger matrin-type protein 5 [Callorhinchus milii]